MSSIPPAPPLPPSRTSQPPTRSAFARITQSLTSRPTQPARLDAAKPATQASQKLLGGITPQSSQSCSLKERGGTEFSSLDTNRDRTHAIIAGKDYLKILRIAGDSCKIESNIFESIVNYDKQNAARNRDTLDIHDVKWSHGEYSNYIATASTSGKVVIYDLGRPGIEVARLHEHSRQVHKVAFNPHGGRFLLSGSSDGTVILWDLREAKPNVQAFHSYRKFNGQSDAVRDVQWSPTEGVEFAIGTDNGTVQKWSFQNPRAPLLRIPAHEAQCTTIDWHPDGKHLISGGHDKYLKVWDTTTESKRPKQPWNIRTPYPISNARWRYNSQSQESISSQCTQISTSYDRKSPIVHIWDFKRPHMPRHELCDWSTAPADMLWASDRLLWTVSREGHFNQVDLLDTPFVLDRRPMSVFAISPTGEISVFAQKRPRRSGSDVDDLRSPHVQDVEQPETFPDRHDYSRGVIDEPIDESLLSSSYRRHYARAMSARSTKSAASTPPSVADPEFHRSVKLNELLSRADPRAGARQTAYSGHLPGVVNSMTVSYLAQKYKTEPLPKHPTFGSYLGVGRLFEKNAQYAVKAGSYRTAQTWRIFGDLITQELKLRAQDNKRQRLLEAKKTPPKKPSPKEPKRKAAFLSPVLSLQNPVVKAIQTGQSTPLGIESTSNVTTPQARPLIHDVLDHHETYTEGKDNSSSLPNLEDDELNLPPSVVDGPGPIAIPTQKITHVSSEPTFEEPDWYLSASQINARKAQMSNWRAAPKVPLDFETGSPANPVPPPRVLRHDSDESFAMLSMSTDSHSGGQPSSFTASVTSARSHRPSMSRIPENHDGVDFDDSSAHPPRILGLQKQDSSLSAISKSQSSWLTSSSELDSQGRSLEPHSHVEASLDASQTIIPDTRIGTKPDVASIQQNVSEIDLIVDDYRTTLENPELIGSISTSSSLLEVLDFYTGEVPNAQLAYHLMSLLAPLLSRNCPAATTSEEIVNLGISMSQIESILTFYYQQLHQLQIYNPAITLARAAYKSHPQLFEVSGSQVGLVCKGCSKPINNPNKMRCESCSKPQAPCPICWQKYPELSVRKASRKAMSINDMWTSRYLDNLKPNSKNDQKGKAPWTEETQQQESTVSQSNLPILWQACLICGHGAHAACLQVLQNNPMLGGKCPTENCLCDCIPGPYRNELNRQAAAVAEERNKGNKSIRKDEVRVRESAAAKSARAILEGQSSTMAAAPTRAEERRVVFAD